ncbi:MAG: ATP-binding cassette domain-containing protein [Alicyclobacillus sp.]|nr:ATP-binding cassette domain-containing protein [Alicyclobacillus sp.]
MRVFLDLMWFFRQEWRSYTVGSAILVLVALINLVPPRVVGWMVDDARRHTLTKAHLVGWLGLILGLGLLVYGLRYVWRHFLYGASARLAQQLRNQLYEHYTRLSPAFYHQHRIGDLMAHATNDIQAVEATAGDGILTLVDSLSTGLIVTATMAWSISWKLTLVALLPMPLLAWATGYYGTLLHRRFLLAQAAFSSLNDKVQENITGVRVVKAFGQEDAELAAFSSLAADVVRKNTAVAQIDALFDPTTSLLVGISYFLSVGAGAWWVVHGQLTVGDLTSFVLYLGELIWPMLAFGWLMNIVERGSASYERIRKLLAMPPAVADPPAPRHVKLHGDIHIHIRSFTYPGAAVPALSGVQIDLPAGTTLGVAGRTGSGKSTLLRLFLREFELADGVITWGGTPLHQVPLAQLRRTVAYVSQEPFLFSATLAENIALGRPAASRSEIEKAAKLAAVHDDIVHFPDRYDTCVGERGVTLSGGQKQRLALARALLLDAELLILDDCLSAVDARTEAEVLNHLRQHRRGRTTLLAAHRISALEIADWVVVLEAGRMVEQGPPADLLAAGGWFAAMAERQRLESWLEQGGRFI